MSTNAYMAGTVRTSDGVEVCGLIRDEHELYVGELGEVHHAEEAQNAG
jgi:hypothetical protein